MGTIVDMGGKLDLDRAIDDLSDKDPTGNLLRAAAQFSILLAGTDGNPSLEMREFGKDKVGPHRVHLEGLLTKRELEIFPAVSEGILYLSEAALTGAEVKV